MSQSKRGRKLQARREQQQDDTAPSAHSEDQHDGGPSQTAAGNESGELGEIEVETLATLIKTMESLGVPLDQPDEVLAHVAALLAHCLADYQVSNAEEVCRWVAETAVAMHAQITEGAAAN